MSRIERKKHELIQRIDDDGVLALTMEDMATPNTLHSARLTDIRWSYEPIQHALKVTLTHGEETVVLKDNRVAPKGNRPVLSGAGVKYKSRRVTLTSPDWMLDALEGLARGNLMRRNKLINSVLFDYIKANLHLFSEERREELAHIINEQAELKRRALAQLGERNL